MWTVLLSHDDYKIIVFYEPLLKPDLLWFLVGSSGLEPPTLRLSGARSNHLSYEPMCSV
jgi:hypothetical protein